MINEREGNSVIGMEGDSLPEDPVDAPTTDSLNDSFFEDLEESVNGAIAQDDEPMATQSQPSGSETATHVQQDDGSNAGLWERDDNPYKKRYSDSSREAVKQREIYKDLEPFVPVLEAMKNDSGLVDHVRGYLQNGGAPTKTVQEQLGLDEDFIFDTNEAMTDPESDSAKVMAAQINGVVNKRVGQMVQAEKANSAKVQSEIQKRNELKEFQERKGMNDEQMKTFVEQAQNHVLTLEDVDYLINRDQVATNTANATRTEMANQMKNVRNIPTSASGANNQGDNRRSAEDSLFDSLVGSDGDLDNLFG